jgi:hypothetical protein
MEVVMWTRIVSTVGVTLSMAMLVAALWGWQNAEQVARHWEHGAVVAPAALWGARSGAAALAAGAQVVLLSVVAGSIFRRDVLSDALRLTGVLLCALAGVSAVALGMAG